MFCGYGWNRYFDATVDPACIGEGVGPCFEESLCMDVSMPATQPHNGVQPVTGIAFNVAQRVNGTKTGYSGGFKSITPTFTTSGLGGEMRAYVSTGSTDYCVREVTSGQALSYEAFRTDCWGDLGEALPPAATIDHVGIYIIASGAAQTGTMCLTGLTVEK